MALLGPDDNDRRKIHAEITQIVNQRLTLTTLGLTVFGVVIAWIIPKETPLRGSPMGVLPFIISTLLIVLLSVLFILNHSLKQMLRTLSTYMDASNASNWEKDWAAYRVKYSYIGYTKPQGIIFLFLGAFTTVFPFILKFAYGLKIDRIEVTIISTFIGFVYFFFVCMMSYHGWFSKEKDLFTNWKNL